MKISEMTPSSCPERGMRLGNSCHALPEREFEREEWNGKAEERDKVRDQERCTSFSLAQEWKSEVLVVSETSPLCDRSGLIRKFLSELSKKMFRIDQCHGRCCLRRGTRQVPGVVKN